MILSEGDLFIICAKPKGYLIGFFFGYVVNFCPSSLLARFPRLGFKDGFRSSWRVFEANRVVGIDTGHTQDATQLAAGVH